MTTKVLKFSASWCEPCKMLKRTIEGEDIGAPVAELAIGLAALIVAAAGYGLICLPGWWKQRKCPHSRVRETGACDAICQSCGKNLGFIGAWRDKQKDKPSNV